MSQEFQQGDFLIFQLEAGFGLLRFLANTSANGEKVWHLAAYSDLFLDAESAEAAITQTGKLTVSHDHLALTTRAFESTQVARLANVPLTEAEKQGLNVWISNNGAEVSDRSVRLLLGLR